ncbi:MAG TPA: alpha/beta fold hydrolase, partial [Gaiellaceae bacterium]
MTVALGVTLLVPAAIGSAVPGAAAADVACGQTPGLVCSQVDVPLDRTGRTPGSISLHVEVLPASGVQRGAMFLIAGGPGQPSARVFSLGTPSDAAYYRALFPGYALVAYDGRGSGRSGPLTCPSGSSGQPRLVGASCAASLGAQRDFYGTGDQAEDLELVRQSLGFDRVALWGTSYGTKLALAYALAHPSNVERLLLDSVVPLEFPDPLSANVLRMIPTALRNFCAGTTCRGATPDFAGDVVAVANGLAAKPLRATVLAPNGSKRTETLDGLDVLSLVVAADLNPGLAAELPAAVRAARRGNPQPLLHTEELSLLGSTAHEAADVSSAVYAATLCHDGPFPWLPTSPLADRSGLLQAALDALPSGSLGPFGHWAANLGSAGLCLDWPSPAGGAALGSGPLPDVPVLALSGGFDMRTPTSDATSVVALFPQGHLLVVPGIGHGILESGAACPEEAVRSWLSGKSV